MSREIRLIAWENIKYKKDDRLKNISIKLFIKYIRKYHLYKFLTYTLNVMLLNKVTIKKIWDDCNSIRDVFIKSGFYGENNPTAFGVKVYQNGIFSELSESYRQKIYTIRNISNHFLYLSEDEFLNLLNKEDKKYIKKLLFKEKLNLYIHHFKKFFND